MEKNKKVRNFVGGAALAATLAFGGASALPIVTHAQTATSTPSASQTQGSQSQNNSGGQQSSGTTQNGPQGFGGKGGHGGGKGGPGAGGPGGLGGTISSISGKTITLSRGNSVTITVTVNSNTTYHEAGKTITLSDLKAGETINVHETKNSDGTTTVDAVDVVLPHAGGTISAINDNTLTLTGPNNTTTTVNLSASTTYNDLGKTISQADLKSGERIDVAGTKNSDGSLNAQVVNVVHDRTGGTVTAINGNSITVQLGGPNGQGGPRPPRPGSSASGSTSSSSTTTPSNTPSNTSNSNTPKTITITVDSNTTYSESGQSASLSNIKVGDQIQAQGTRSSDGSSFGALQVEIQLPHYHGQVTSVSGSTITIQDRSGTHTINTNSSTKFLNGTATASLSDVKTGANIDATGTVDANGAMTATQVQLGRPTPPAGAPMPPANNQQAPANGQES